MVAAVCSHKPQTMGLIYVDARGEKVYRGVPSARSCVRKEARFVFFFDNGSLRRPAFLRAGEFSRMPASYTLQVENKAKR